MSAPLLNARVPNYSSLDRRHDDGFVKAGHRKSSLDEEELFESVCQKVDENGKRHRCRRASTSSSDLSVSRVLRRRCNTYPQDEDYTKWSFSEPEDPNSDRHGQQNGQNDNNICVSNHNGLSPKASQNKLDGIQESWTQKMFSCRWKIAYLCFLVRALQSGMRQSFSVAILGVAVEYSRSAFVSHNDSGNITFTMIRVSTWSSQFEGIAMAAFNSGSIISPFLCGYLSLRIRGRLLTPICLLLGGLFSVLLPALAKFDPVLIVVCRVVSGASMTGFDSLIQSIWSKWAPKREKASLTSCSYTGSTLGGLLAFPISSLLISINGDGKGWPYIFYFFGSCCFALAPSWWFCVYDNPHEHPRLSEREMYILKTDVYLSKTPAKKQNSKIPWCRIFTSGPVWAVLVGYVNNKWAMCFVLPFLPRFFHDSLHQSITNGSLYTTMPFLGGMIASATGAMVSDWLLSKDLSVRFIRKLFQMIGCLGCAVCCVLLIMLLHSPNPALSTIVIILLVAFQNLTNAAYRINLLDIAPRYAGLLCGGVTTISSLIALPAPVLCSMLIAWKSPDGWQMVFTVVAVFNVAGGLTFLLLSQGTVQDWAVTEYDYTVESSGSSCNYNDDGDISGKP